MYLFDDDNSGIIPNNSVIVTDIFGRLPQLQCASGSQSAGVGKWVTPTGRDVTATTNDPFDVVIGGQDNPGYLDIMLHPGRILTLSDQGVYACRIPDEIGVISTLYVGIYLPTLAGIIIKFIRPSLY